MMKNVRIEILDGPNREGEYTYVLTWIDEGGVFRPEASKEDGLPVGYRRGQYFHAKLTPKQLEAAKEGRYVR